MINSFKLSALKKEIENDYTKVTTVDHTYYLITVSLYKIDSFTLNTLDIKKLIFNFDIISFSANKNEIKLTLK